MLDMQASESASVSGHVVKTDLLILVLTWFVGLLIVNPLGNFPLNDDWSYGLTVKHFLDFGQFRPTENVAMPLLTNVLWGSLFCLLKGFSFTALRLSTLCMSLTAILATYYLMFDLSRSRLLGMVAALTLGFNPIYYAISNTFMTDVTFLAIILVAAIFFVRNLRADSDLDLMIGIILCIAATLSRQLAISVPLAFCLSRFLKYGFARRNTFRAIIPAFICIAGLLLFQHWLAASGRLSAEYYVKINGLVETLSEPKRLVFSFVKNSFVGLLYLGLFLFPVLLLIISGIWRSHKKRVGVVLPVAIVVLAVGTLIAGLHGFSPACTSPGSYPNVHLMPMSANVLTKSGIGPVTLPDNWVGAIYMPVLPEIPGAFWFVVTAMSVLGAGLLITSLYVGLIKLLPSVKCAGEIGDMECIGAFLLATAGIYLLPLLASSYIDRYLVTAVPFLAIGITCLSGKPQELAIFKPNSVNLCAIAVLVAFSVFAIGCTKDYLAWNRARWEALGALVRQDRIDVGEIDGGLEFNGLYTYDPNYKYDPQKSWWWVQGNTYLICFGPKPGYKLVREYSYQHWLPPYSGKIVVLQKAR